MILLIAAAVATAGVTEGLGVQLLEILVRIDKVTTRPNLLPSEFLASAEPPSSSSAVTMAPATHLLYESASGYALFEAKLVEEIGTKVCSSSVSMACMYSDKKLRRKKSKSRSRTCTSLERWSSSSHSSLSKVPHTLLKT